MPEYRAYSQVLVNAAVTGRGAKLYSSRMGPKFGRVSRYEHWLADRFSAHRISCVYLQLIRVIQATRRASGFFLAMARSFRGGLAGAAGALFPAADGVGAYVCVGSLKR
jgi:hypothetical protein